MKAKGLLAVWLLIVLFSSGYSVFAGALDNWHWRNPLPNGNPQAGPPTLIGVVFTNGYFVAVGTSGVVSISSDGTNWTESGTATTNTLNALTCVNGLYLAVGAGGVVETSIDRTNWVLQASGTTDALAAVTYGNGNFVAVGPNIAITSPDAVHWSSAVSGLAGATGVAGGNAGFVAVAGSDQVYFSPNGSVWTSETFTTPTNIYESWPLQNSIVTFANGVYLVGSSRQDTTTSADEFIFRSTDGQSWTTNALGNVPTGPSGLTYNFFMVANSTFVAAGITDTDAFYQFSPDGINWTSTNAVPWGYGQGTSGAYGNGTYVVVTPAPRYPLGSLPQILVSTDGVDWTNVEQPPSPPTGPAGSFTSIAFTNGIYVVAASNSVVRSTDGLVYAAVSNSPALSSVITYAGGFIGAGPGGNIYVSDDGLTWTQRNSGTANSLHGIASNGSQLVAVGDDGMIQTSPTGTVWTGRTSGTSLPLYGIIFANGLFVAVGKEGTVLTSPDGISWTGQYSGQLEDLRSLAYGSAGFTAVGPSGTILTSPDAVNWTGQNSGTAAALESITFGNGYYLATGDGAVVLTSPDGVNWTPRNIGATGAQKLYGSAFLNSRFDVTGSGGTLIESDVIAPLFAVQIQRGAGQNICSVFITPGSSFHIQASTDLASWSNVASFSSASAITWWTNSTSGFNQRFFRAVSP